MWALAAVGCVVGFVGKQLLWKHVSTKVAEVRDIEHAKAVKVYDETIHKSKQFALPPLTAEQRLAIQTSWKAEGRKDVVASLEQGGEVVGPLPVPIATSSVAAAAGSECCSKNSQQS